MNPERILEIELSGKCNLKCVMCVQATGFDGRLLSISEFGKILESENGNYNTITLHGAGEVLLSPVFEDALKLIPEDKTIHFLSNGTKLDNEKTELVLKYAHRISVINVSIDAATFETYQDIRGADFVKTVTNLKTFINVREARKLSTPKIVLNFTAMKRNINEIPSMVLLASALDKEVHVWPLLDAPQYLEGDWRIKRKEYTFDYDQECIRGEMNELYDTRCSQAQILADTMGVKFWKHTFYNGPTVQEKINDCAVPKYNSVYYSSGKVKHCCLQTKEVFDWRKEGVQDLANHPRTQEIISLMEKGVIPKECHKAGCNYVRGKSATEDTEIDFEVSWIKNSVGLPSSYIGSSKIVK